MINQILSVLKNTTSEIYQFFKEEKTYSYLFCFAICSFLLLSFLSPNQVEEPSEVIQQVKQIEDQLKQEDQTQLILDFFKEATLTESFFMILIPLLIFGGIFLGAFIDVNIISQWAKGKEIIKARLPRTEIPWSVRDIAKCIIFILFSTLVFSAALSSFHSLLDNKGVENLWTLLLTIFIDVVIVLFILNLLNKEYQTNFSSLGLRFKYGFKDLGLGLLSYSAILPVIAMVLALLVVITEMISYEPPPHELVEIFLEEDKKNPMVIYLSVFLACTIGPIVEEIFFRGFCYPAFRKKWGAKWAMVLSSAFFASIHGSIFAFFPIFVLGMVLAYVYEKSNSLVPSIVIHVVHNSIFIGYFFLIKHAFFDKYLG